MASAAHSFLLSFAGVLSTAAVTTVCFQKLRWPVVLGYLLAGILLGPEQFGGMLGVVDSQHVHIMAELGVILLMFCIGLEFSLADLARAGGRGAIMALFGMGTMLWLGYTSARLFGFTPILSVFVAAMLAISSTTLVLRVLDDEGIVDRVRDLMLSLLVVEDLIAILLLALLTTLSTTQNFSWQELAQTAGRLLLFLTVLMVVGLLVVPRMMRLVLALKRDETTLVASLGFAFLLSMLALKLGYSAALGAFLAGSLLAEAGAGKVVLHLVHPVRDVFVAVFFVAIGMTINLSVILADPKTVLALSALVVLGKGLGVAAGAFAVGAGVRDSIRAGISAGQIGEFSFIIAGLAISLPGAERIAVLAVAISACTATLSPIMVRHASKIASTIERKLPHPVQAFASLYGSWLADSSKAQAGNQSLAKRLRNKLLQLCFDLILVAAVLIAASVFDVHVARFIDQRTDWAAMLVRSVAFALCLLPLLPLLFGAMRIIRSFANEFALAAMPKRSDGDADFATAPRSVFVLALEFGLSTAALLAVLALTQPFLPAGFGVGVAVLLLLLFAWAFWRSTKQLHGHMRAGAMALLEMLQVLRPKHSALPSTSDRNSNTGGSAETSASNSSELVEAEQLMPGIGSLHVITIASDSPVLGRSLAELDLRALTGASVLLIRRGETALLQPSGSELVAAGDDLVLSGEDHAVHAAMQLLQGLPAGASD